MGSDERELAEVLRIKRRRLRSLEKAIARLGYDARPEQVNEAEDLREELEADRATLEPVIKGDLSVDAMAALRVYGLPDAVKRALQNFEERLYDLKNDVKDLRDQQSRLREKESSDRETRQIETDKQRDHVNMQLIRINVYVRLTSGLLFLFAVGAVVWLVLRIFFAADLAGLGR